MSDSVSRRRLARLRVHSRVPKGSDDHFPPGDRGWPSPLRDIIGPYDAVLREGWSWGSIRNRSTLLIVIPRMVADIGGRGICPPPVPACGEVGFLPGRQGL